MKKFNYKSKLGFTLIELLVVIGILAVLAAIAIPAVAGLIDRANVSADDTNANEMTNSVERFVSEYELFKQDIASGKFDKNKMDSAQGRVYAVTGVEDRAGIEALEGTGTADGILLNIDTKYPVNEKTLKRVVNNYMKTSASTFTPKQSDCSYYYSPALGTVICAETGSTIDDLSAIVLSYDSASVVRNSTMLATASNGVQVEWMNMTLNSGLEEAEWTDVVYATETKNEYKALSTVSIDMSTVSPVLAENDWETIQTVIRAGKATEAGWTLGDTTPSFTINGVAQTAKIIGIDHDGINTVTFMVSSDITNTIGKVMNSSGRNNGGWKDSEMRDWLNGEVFNGMTPELKSVIKPVNKNSNLGNRTTGIVSTTDNLFLISFEEAGLTNRQGFWTFQENYKTDLHNEGNTYPYFSDGNNLSSFSDWLWFRSANCTDEYSFFSYYRGDPRTEVAYVWAKTVPAFVIG